MNSLVQSLEGMLSKAVGLPFRAGMLRRLLVRGLPLRSRRALARYSLRQLGFDGPSSDKLDDVGETFAEIRQRLEGDEHTVFYSLRVYGAISNWMASWCSGFSGKRLLEFGPGWSLGTGALLVAAGAESYVGADLFPLAALHAEPYRQLREELANDRDLVRSGDFVARREAMLRRFDEVVQVDGDRVSFDESHLAWRYPVDAAATPFADASFDVCLSNATMEHVREPRAVVAESLRVLSPGGTGFHQVDFRDHRDFSRPLEFLRIDARDWAALFSASGDPRRPGARAPSEYTNRWRLGDFVKAFREAGAEIVSVERNLVRPLDKTERAGFHPDFQDCSQEDLETLGALLIVRRR